MKRLNQDELNALVANAESREEGNFAICAQVELFEQYTFTIDGKETFVVVESELSDGYDAILNSSHKIESGAFTFFAAYSFETAEDSFEFYAACILNNR